MEQISQYIFDAVSQNQFFQGGIILGLLTAIGYKLKSIPTMIWAKVRYLATYSVYFDDTNPFYDEFVKWFEKKCPKKFKNVEVKMLWLTDPRYSSGMEPCSAPVAYSNEVGMFGWFLRKFQYSDRNFLWYKNRLIWISKDRRELTTGNVNGSLLFINHYSLSGLFAKNVIDDICEQILKMKREESMKQDYLRVGIDSYGHFEWRDLEIVKTFDHLFFEGKDDLIKDLERFVTRKDFYKKRGINFKRNYLFYGPPGTGKTSIATAIAKRLGYTLFVINLAALENDADLVQIGNRVTNKAVVLLEDIDCVLKKRDVTNDKLNFATVLNFLDGLTSPSDVIMVMTTNHPELLDGALKRKGRCDFTLEIGYPRFKDVNDFISDFFGQPISIGVGDSLEWRSAIPMASVQDICLRNDKGLALNTLSAECFGPNYVVTTLGIYPVDSYNPDTCPGTVLVRPSDGQLYTTGQHEGGVIGLDHFLRRSSDRGVENIGNGQTDKAGENVHRSAVEHTTGFLQEIPNA